MIQAGEADAGVTISRNEERTHYLLFPVENLWVSEFVFFTHVDKNRRRPSAMTRRAGKGSRSASSRAIPTIPVFGMRFHIRARPRPFATRNWNRRSAWRSISANWNGSVSIYFRLTALPAAMN